MWHQQNLRYGSAWRKVLPAGLFVNSMHSSDSFRLPGEWHSSVDHRSSQITFDSLSFSTFRQLKLYRSPAIKAQTFLRLPWFFSPHQPISPSFRLPIACSSNFPRSSYCMHAKPCCAYPDRHLARDSPWNPARRRAMPRLASHQSKGSQSLRSECSPNTTHNQLAPCSNCTQIICQIGCAFILHLPVLAHPKLTTTAFACLPILQGMPLYTMLELQVLFELLTLSMLHQICRQNGAAASTKFGM